MRSFIDAGNVILTAKDVFKALHYGKGIQNVKGCLYFIDTSKAPLSPWITVPKTSKYDSFEFHHDYMIMWRSLVLKRGKDQTTQIFPLRLRSQWCCHLAVQLLVSWKVQECQRKEDMKERYVIHTSGLWHDVWIPSKM